MSLNTAPRPWNVSGNREIADGAGNTVQYTVGNLGQICLAVNAYDKLIDVVRMIDAWLLQDSAERCSEKELGVAINEGLGRVGLENLAGEVEALGSDSAAVDRMISEALSVPLARYTDSADAAMSLLPKGARYGMSNQERVSGAGEPIVVIVVEVKTSNGKIAFAANPSFARALAAAAIRAHVV